MLSSTMSNYLHRSLLSKPCKPKHDDCHDDDGDDDDNHHELSSLQVLMICTLAAMFFFVCCIIFIKIRRALQARRRRRIMISNNHVIINTNEDVHQDFIDADQEPVVFHPIWLINTVGLDQSVIDSIEMFKYRSNEDGLIDSDCAVCLGVFQEDESLRILPKCTHAFHLECIDTWLRSHKNCPVRRAPVVRIPQTHPNSVQSTSQEEEIIPRNGTIVGVENNAGEIDTNAESLDKNSCTSGVRVQSDLSNQCSRKLEPMRRSVSIGSFRFVDRELVASQEPNVGRKSGKRRGSGSSTIEEGRALHSGQD